ncbi:MAG: alpha/beta fold hydrolase [Telluria sp.]
MTKLVLLPGMDGTGDLFAPLLNVLDKRVTVHVIRYPSREMLTYADLVCQVRDVLPDDEAFFLLGESFSGPVALSIAAERPPGLRGVILCASFIESPRPALSKLSWLSYVIPFRWLPSRAVAYPLFGRYSTKQLRSSLSRALAKVSTRVLQNRLRQVMKVNVRTLSHKVQVPLLYLRAEDDLLVPQTSLDAVCGSNPSTLVAHFKAPHMLLQTVPGQAAAVIEAFMNRYRNGRGEADASAVPFPGRES